MADYDISLGRELLPGLLSGQDGLAKLVETVLNQILEAQVTESLGADRHERSEERQGYRNGYRARTLFTRVGPVTLQVPQTRDGSFSTDIFKRYQRSEQAFVLALMEMVVQGVSTRKVSAITEELCGASFSKSTVSALCVGLDARVRAFNERRLEGEYPFVLVDALFIKSREADRVVMRAALVVTGVRSEGFREIPGYQDRGYRKLCHLGRDLPLAQEARTQGRSVCDLGSAWRARASYRQALPRRDLPALPGASDAQPSRSLPSQAPRRRCGRRQACPASGGHDRGTAAASGIR